MEFSFFDMALRGQKSYARLLEPVCARWHLTRNELDVLLFLANNPGQDRAADIVRGRGISKGHVSMSLHGLEVRGLLTRREESEDRRNVHMTLTEAAGEIVRDGQEAQRFFVSHLMEGITPEKNEILWAAARKMGENILKLEQEL